MKAGQDATVILDALLARYQSEMLDRIGSLGRAFYEYYSGTPLSDGNAIACDRQGISEIRIFPFVI